MNSIPKIQVFLSTYNGEKYIKEQIISLISQECVEVSILVRDDGSTDNTCRILSELSEQGLIKFYPGKNVGYAKSFLDLVRQECSADYYAFCDQDDVWLPDKLISAVKKIKRNGISCSGKPILYASSLQRVDENLKFLELQSFKNLKLTLGAEFTRHRLAGCTFVFNEELRNLLKKSTDDLICSHDRLATILTLACDGKLFFDTVSYILFRRHGTNTSVDGIGILNKIKKDLNHYFSGGNDASKLAEVLLDIYKEDLNNKAISFLTKVANYKNTPLNTIKLSLNKQIDCGFWFFNIYVRAMILIRLF